MKKISFIVYFVLLGSVILFGHPGVPTKIFSDEFEETFEKWFFGLLAGVYFPLLLFIITKVWKYKVQRYLLIFVFLILILIVTIQFSQKQTKAISHETIVLKPQKKRHHVYDK